MSNQIVPLELVFRNFFSYGNNFTHIPLNFKKPTLIIGRNIDHSVGGQVDSNGAGKSVIINAITYALFGRTIGSGKRIKVDDLINWINGKNMEVGLHFQKNEDFYYIERYRKNAAKGGDGVRIFKGKKFSRKLDGYEDETKAMKSDADIVNLIGMPYDVFTRIILFSASHDSFFDLPATAASGASQSDIMEELFNLVELSEDAEKLKAKNDDDKLNLKQLSTMQDQIASETERHEAQIANVKKLVETWNINQHSKIWESETLIATLKDFNFEENRQILSQMKTWEDSIVLLNRTIDSNKEKLENHKRQERLKETWDTTHKENIKTTKAAIAKLAKVDFEEQNTFVNIIETTGKEKITLRNEITVLRNQIETKDKKTKELHDEIDHLKDNKCPYCLQEYEAAKAKVTEKQDQWNILVDEKTTIGKEVQFREEKLVELTNQQSEILPKLLYLTQKDLTQAEASFNNTMDKLEALTKETNPYTVDVIDADTLNNEVISHTQTIRETEDQILEAKLKAQYKTERELISAEHDLDSKRKDLERVKNETNPHIETYEHLKDAKLPESKQAEIEALRDDIEHQEFLYKLLTKKDSYIRKALMAKNLTYLNEKLRYYLDKLGLQHKVQFNYNMTVDISLFRQKIPYVNLSSGQKARINLALWAAFRKVREKRFGKIPFCMLDEALDTGLGNVGVQDAAKMIKNIATEEGISTFVISHRDEIATMFESKLEIELKNKFSNIVSSDIAVEVEEAEVE